jgi:predicted ABC-type exoprotein transport system permease subunit
MTLFLVLLPFVFIAAVMSYVTTYQEWQHHYPTKKEPRKLACEAGIFTLIFFSILLFFVLYLLNYTLGK